MTQSIQLPPDPINIPFGPATGALAGILAGLVAGTSLGRALVFGVIIGSAAWGFNQWQHYRYYQRVIEQGGVVA